MELAHLFVTLGALFLAGLAADSIGRRTLLPRVTLLLLCGIAVGSSGLNLLPAALENWYEALSVIALTMVAFLLGNSLNRKNLARNGRAILGISIVIVLSTILIVALGLWLIGLPPEVALLLGAISTATDPAATQDAIKQAHAKGQFPEMLRSIVAIDDAWGLIVFAITIALAHGITGGLDLTHLVDAVIELSGALLLGLFIGIPAAYLTGRLKKGEPQQTEALGVVFLTAGLALWLDVSFLLAGMTAGMVIANFARHHGRAFHQIEHLQWPFMILFFLLAGAALDVSALWEVGLIGLAYAALRILARIIGGWVGATAMGTDPATRKWFGVALLPQAGVAVGMALVAAREFPEAGEMILTITIGTTVLFELIGPVGTMLAVRQVQQSNAKAKAAKAVGPP